MTVRAPRQRDTDGQTGRETGRGHACRAAFRRVALAVTLLAGSAPSAPAQTPSAPQLPVVLIPAVPTPAPAAERPLRAGVLEGTAPPRAGVDGQFSQGLLPDLMRMVADDLARPVEMISVPRKRIYQILATDQIDLVCTLAEGWIPTPERPRFALSVPLFSEQNVIVGMALSGSAAAETPEAGRPEAGKPEAGRPDVAPVLNGLKDLAGTIATVRGYLYPDLDPLFAAGTLTRIDAPDEAAALKMVTHGRTRYAILNRMVYGWNSRTVPPSAPFPLPLLLMRPEPVYCAVSATGPERDAVLGALRRIAASGQVEQRVLGLQDVWR
ncbi:substrate-binding periplasmic protein [Novispirillum itersonii]|uniref:substrate-binding periplasmic protein n=1 Tax=Novispirillum itersonii TaxID=189 RepID=UPI0004782E9D|nr:transporter substrate-binding domain-containing protein [Novispirillum itersonii]